MGGVNAVEKDVSAQGAQEKPRARVSKEDEHTSRSSRHQEEAAEGQKGLECLGSRLVAHEYERDTEE